MPSLRSHTYDVRAEGNGNRAVQTAVWLLEHGATVVMTDEEVRERIIARIQKRSPDGAAYAKTVSRLCRNAPSSDLADDRALLGTVVRTPAIIAHDASVAHWSRCLLEHGTMIGPDDSPLLLDERSTKAGVIHDDPGLFPDSPRLIKVRRHETGFAVAGRSKTMAVSPVIDVHDGSLRVTLNGRITDIGRLPDTLADRAEQIGAAVLAVHLLGVPPARIRARFKHLTPVPHDRHILRSGPDGTIIDDAVAQTPEASAATVRMLGGPTAVLICGGQAAGAYGAWAETVKKHIRPTNLILMEGTGLVHMRRALGSWGVGIRAYGSLTDAVRAARARAIKYVSSRIIHSPACIVREYLSDILP